MEMGRIRNKKVCEKRTIKLKRDVYMLRRENDNSFIKKKSVDQFSFKIYLYFWLVHVVGDCSKFILCTRALFELRKN